MRRFVLSDEDESWVQTDMGNSGAQALGMEKAEIPVAESVSGMIKVVCRLSFWCPGTLCR